MRIPDDMTPRIIKRSDIQFPEVEIPEQQGNNSPGWINIPGGRIQIQFPQRNFVCFDRMLCLQKLHTFGGAFGSLCGRMIPNYGEANFRK
ncbi:hypothetical protein Ddye_030068 [Dipteronia dyeriana]|uniref:Uncharacterized protein n=1 Tax=Dipteronia dyeriana TaxID=168575 RepID=A0AAD9TFZ4_9ROSI|nr:hypothetical protein Ddye_030068 [Dipteronia dyeriana]